MSIPNLIDIVNATKDKYNRAWLHCHVEGDPEGWDFAILAIREMNKYNPNFGLNGKHGQTSRAYISWDAVNWRGDGNDGPNVIDFVAGAGGSNPQPVWQVTNTTGIWIDPYSEYTYYNYGNTNPIPVPPTVPPTVPPDIDLAPIVDELLKLNMKFDNILAKLDEQTRLIDSILDKLSNFYIDQANKTEEHLKNIENKLNGGITVRVRL